MKLQLSVCCSVGDCSVPSSDVTSCGTGSSFLHVTFVLVLMLRLFGTNFIPLILTVASSPPALTPLLFCCSCDCCVVCGVACCCAQLASNKSVIVRTPKIIFLFIVCPSDVAL